VLKVGTCVVPLAMASLLAVQLAVAAQSQKASVIEASVPVHRQMASSTLLVAGDSSTIDEWSSLLECIPRCFQAQEESETETKMIRCGEEVGAAGLAQLCASHHLAIQMLGWLETRSLAARLGLPSETVDTMLSQFPAPTLLGDDTEAGGVDDVNVTVEVMESQLRDAVESARQIQAPVPMGALAAQVYGMVGTGGYIDLDYSVVDRAIYAPANAEAAALHDSGEVALSVDTIQQSLDVSR
jgi:3-hydroxyisobutyrate dehydrogenase-like beta-hydroxyacid dehydrogenase